MSVKIALAGVPNCGKTSFWNIVTGKSAATGNRSGVTLKISSANITGINNALLFDLPGAYSLSSESFEEKAAKDFLISGNIDSVIILIDGTKPEQGIYFALEILSLGIPAVLGINFCDELRAQNIKVDTAGLSYELNIPVFLISAKEKYNVNELLCAAVQAVGSVPKAQSRLSSESRHRKSAAITKKYFSEPKSFGGFSNPTAILQNSVLVLVPVLVLLLGDVLKHSFELLFEHGTALFNITANFLNVSSALTEFIFEGVLLGLKSLILFIPELFAIFFMLDFLESSGYTSRFAFSFDFMLKKIGLSGLSLIPLLLGFGCTVPAVYAAKAIENKVYQKRTLSALMFVPCGAKLPLSLFVCELVFREKSDFILFLFYFAVIFFGFSFLFLQGKNKSPGFIMELPKIRFPRISSVLKTSFGRLEIFISKAGTVLVLTAVVLWLLKNFNFELNRVHLQSESILYTIGKFISPIFSPVGIPKEGGIALLCGIFSKEASLFTLSELIGAQNIFSTASACSFLIFYLIYSPCVGCLAAIKEEFGIKKAVWLSLRQTALGYFAAFAFYQIFTLLQNIFSL